jgi:NitT/TauT family transport system substrate-binding protein
MALMQTRREFLTALSLAGPAGLLSPPRVLAAERELETTTVRLAKGPGICIAPQYVAEELLRAEGFTEIRYVEKPAGATEPLARGEIDFDTNYASNCGRAIDAGEPITLLVGVHVGCLELFGNEGIRSITDLKGKSVGVQALESNNHVLVTLQAAQVGLDPSRISTGSPSRRSSRSSVSSRARSMPSSAFRRSRRICAPGISAT